jgi:thioredoxin-like negative regulator of GroEL
MRFLLRDIELKIQHPNLVLYFYAPLTPYHPMMLNLLERVEKFVKGIQMDAIDAMYFDGLCRRFEVKSLPTLVFLKRGQIIDRLDGVPSLSKILDICSIGA